MNTTKKTKMFDARQIRDFVKAVKRETGCAWSMFGGRIQEALIAEYALGVLAGQAADYVGTDTINELRYAMLVEAGLRDPK